jgi:hypothetical protein
VAREQLTFRVHIHELADAEAAQRFWTGVTEADAYQFRRPTIKRHNPKTVRKNVGEDYHGCLCVRVRQCAELYQKIEGWAGAVMGDPARVRPGGSGSEPQVMKLPDEDSNLGSQDQNLMSCQLDDPGRFGC